MTSAPFDFFLPFALCFCLILLVPLAIAGITLINTGLGRSRSAAHAMTSSLCVISAAVLVYFVWGFALQGYPFDSGFFGAMYHTTVTPPGLFLRGVDFRSAPTALAALLGLFSVALASVIPLGAASDRWRISAAVASTVLLAGFTYPIFGHIRWHGFLSMLGVSSRLGDYLRDAGGSGVIQVTAGLTALSIAWLLGPRQGKYLSNGMPAAIPAHNGVYVLFGCMLTWIGWLGLNSAGAMLYNGILPKAPC